MPLPKADQMSSWPDIVPLLTTRCLYWGCQGANRGVEVPYTMFQNPRSKPSCHKSTKTIITQKVLVTQSSNIVHCNWHTQKSISADFQAFLNTFSLFKLTFFNFLSGGVQETAINFTFCWFWLGKMHWNSLSGAYIGFKACQIQWHWFWVSMISSSWKIKISGEQ